MNFDKTLQDDHKINMCVPSDKDVLCGRGAPINKHPGNIIFRKLVKYNKGLYNVCEKNDRLNLAKSIVMALEEQDPPTRFLEQYDDGTGSLMWTTISKERAIRKSFQALRERTPSSRDTQHQKSINSTMAGNSDKGKQVHFEKRVAWENVLKHTMPESLDLHLVSTWSSESLNGSIVGKKRPRNEMHYSTPNIPDVVSSGYYQQLLQPNFSNIQEKSIKELETSGHLKVNFESYETVNFDCTNKIGFPAIQISLDQSLDDRGVQIEENKINDKTSHSQILSESNFYVDNINPVKSSNSNSSLNNELPELSSEIDLLSDESSFEFLEYNDDITMKQGEGITNKVEPSSLDNPFISGENADIENWINFDDDLRNNKPFEIKEDTNNNGSFDNFIGKLICT